MSYMDSPYSYGHKILWFGGYMLDKLMRNDSKSHWKGYTHKWLLHRLRQETGELEKAITSGDPREIISEAADIANFAMMIADNANERGPEATDADKD